MINLSADKERVLRRPSASLSLVAGSRSPTSSSAARFRRKYAGNMELWIGCVAGALEMDSRSRARRRRLSPDFDIEPTRIYKAADAEAFSLGSGSGTVMFAAHIRRKVHERIRARRETGGIGALRERSDRGRSG